MGVCGSPLPGAHGEEKPSWWLLRGSERGVGGGLGACGWCIPVVPDRDGRVLPPPSLSPTEILRGDGLGSVRDKSRPLPLQPIAPGTKALQSRPAASSCPHGRAPRPRAPSAPGGAAMAPIPPGTAGLSIPELLPGRLFPGELRGGQGEVWDVLVFL